MSGEGFHRIVSGTFTKKANQIGQGKDPVEFLIEALAQMGIRGGLPGLLGGIRQAE